MKFPLSTGRYVLDRHGKLHPLRRRYHIEAVAIVHVQMKRQRPREAARHTPPTPVRTPLAKIDLAAVPSSMEARAATWKGNR